MKLCQLLGLVTLLGLTGVARAGGVVALGDVSVAQYAEAIGAAKEVLRTGPLPLIDPSLPDVAERIKRAEPAVILAVGQKALQVAHEVMPGVPTVFCMVLSSASASRTVTGLTLEVAPATQLARFKQITPSVKRLGIIYDPRVSAVFVDEANKAAGSYGITLVAKPVASAREVRAALGDIAGDIDALWLAPDPHLITAEMFYYLLVFTLERKLALFGFLDSFTKVGALASVSPDYREIGARAAKLAAELAARPDAARLPVPPPMPSPGALSINVKTANQLGLEIPPSVLAAARQVYR